MSQFYDEITGMARRKRQVPQPETAFTPTPSPASASAPAYGFAPGEDLGFRNTSVGGYTPDYESLLKNEPGYLDISSQLGKASVTDLSSRDAAIRRALGIYGEVPQEFGSIPGLSQAELTGLVDPQTRQTAQANTAAGLSTKAKLDRIAQQNLQAIQRSFAARGGLRSGATRKALGDEALNDRTRRSEAMSQLIEYLTGYALAYARSQDQRGMTQAQAAIAARDKLLQDPTKQPVAGRDVVELGPGVYFDPAANTYVDASGNPISDPYSVTASSGATVRRGSGSRQHQAA